MTCIDVELVLYDTVGEDSECAVGGLVGSEGVGCEDGRAADMDGSLRRVGTGIVDGNQCDGYGIGIIEDCVADAAVTTVVAAVDVPLQPLGVSRLRYGGECHVVVGQEVGRDFHFCLWHDYGIQCDGIRVGADGGFSIVGGEGECHRTVDMHCQYMALVRAPFGVPSQSGGPADMVDVGVGAKDVGAGLAVGTLVDADYGEG